MALKTVEFSRRFEVVAGMGDMEVVQGAGADGGSVASKAVKQALAKGTARPVSDDMDVLVNACFQTWCEVENWSPVKGVFPGGYRSQMEQLGGSSTGPTKHELDMACRVDRAIETVDAPAALLRALIFHVHSRRQSPRTFPISVSGTVRAEFQRLGLSGGRLGHWWYLELQVETRRAIQRAPLGDGS